MHVRMWASWLAEGRPIFEGDLDECFRLHPVTPGEERDARKALKASGVYYGGCGGEYRLRRIDPWKPAIPPRSNLLWDAWYLALRLWGRATRRRNRPDWRHRRPSR